MSNTSTNYAELNVTNDDMKEMLAEGTFQPVAEQKTAPVKKKNVGYRILALILTIAPIVCLCLINITLIISTTSGYAVYDKSTLLNAVMSLFKKDGLSEFYKKAAEVVTGAATSGFDSYKFMGLPVLSGTGTIGKLMGLVLYAMPAAMVVTVVLMIIALCSGKAAPAMTRAIAFINFWVYGGYALCVLAVSLYYANIEKTFDVVVLAIAGAFFLLYLILSFLKAGKRTWMTLLLFLLTAAFAGAYVYGISKCADGLKTLFASSDTSFINSLTKGEFYKYATVGVLGIALLAAAVSSIRLATRKGYTFDLIRYIFNLLVAGAVIYAAFTLDELKSLQLYAGIAAGIALVLIVLVIIALGVLSKKKKAAKKAAAAEEEPEKAQVTEEETQETAAEETVAVAPVAEETQPEEETTQETAAVTEEEPEQPEEAGVYAEAVRFEGYPTTQETVREAEELAEPAAETEQPAQEPAVQQAPVYNYNFSAPTEPQPAAGAGATADYDFYNSRSFDPFIASLNSAEREQFTELFILKYKGETKNLPDYQVGGDNTEFFRKVFIYLGQYRDRIPDSLLGKMYQFAIRK